jgi:ribosomal 50S subunit-associated protein YjgA (DUF615 family)
MGDIHQPNFCKANVVGCAFFVHLDMKSLVITPKSDSEFKFVADLLKKLGVNSAPVSKEELEDIGMSKLMRNVDKTKKASRSEIMRKLS